MVKVSCDLIMNKINKMENNLRVKLIDEARRNGSKFGKKAELDFGAGAEWMYNELQKQLTLTDVVKCTCEPHKPITKWKGDELLWTCEICKKPC